MTATAVVVDPHAQAVLLVWHLAWRRWMFPGGHLDPGESADQAALREVFEETGVAAAIAHPELLEVPGMLALPSPWLTYEVPAPAKPHKGVREHIHLEMIYIAVAHADAPVSCHDEGVGQAAWFPIAELPGACRAEVPLLAPLALARLRPGIR